MSHPPRIWTPPLVAAAAVACAFTLAACGPEGAAPAVPATPAVQPVAAGPAAARPPVRTAQAAAPAAAVTGVVTAIETLTRNTEPTGAGAVVGGLLGAAIGNQIGGGDGRKVATAAGAVGGAVVGHNVEKQRGRTVIGYRVQVRMDDGAVRSFQRSHAGDLAVGARVRVSGETLITV